jgi:hypothetical protein
MGVPDRFAIEYPMRCLELIEAAEDYAVRRKLEGSFALLAASAVLTIPFERMAARHKLHDKERDADLAGAVGLLSKTPFLKAPFWEGAPPTDWRMSRVMTPVNEVEGWRDGDGLHPLDENATNTIKRYTAKEVIRVIRNALAHGNIIYLNAQYREVPGDRMAFIAFLSQYEETEEQRKASETYRLLVVPETAFLGFVKRWAAWIGGLDQDVAILPGEAVPA